MIRPGVFLLCALSIFISLLFSVDESFSQIEVTIPLNANEQKLISVEKLSGLNSNMGIKAKLANSSGKIVKTIVPAGLVILSEDQTKQNMLTVHEQIFILPPENLVEIRLKTVCLEAWKNPPDSASEKGLFFFNRTENSDISQLIRTIAKLEEIISRAVVDYNDGQIRLRDMDTYELMELALHSEFSPIDSVRFSAKISEQIIQCALWQLTDRISFEDYCKILKPKTEKEKHDLHDIAEMAQILLAYSGLKPTIALRRLLPLKINK